MIHIADNLSFPLDAVTQTFGILAVRGSGKSNTAAVMAEQMFAAKLPFVAIDPVGAWWGLRASRDPRGVGLSIPIFGGRHGDVPLERTGGQVIADLVADERLSCVLDSSEFSEGDKTRFLIDFAERLYRRNQDPLHLFLEEADDFIPQRPFREQARCLHAWENIVRRGRARGLGITMITQRSAALNKNVLTQIETLIVLRTTSPQDRKAIEGWVEYHGQAKTLLESLPSLENGEAWVWSPSWLKVLKRVKIHQRLSFDSGATPKAVHGKRPPATLADVDLGAIQKRMVATIERAKAEDPKELRRRIADLERQLNLAKNLTPTKSDPQVIEREVQRRVAQEVQKTHEAIERAKAGLERTVGKLTDIPRKLLQEIEGITEQAGKYIAMFSQVATVHSKTAPAVPHRPILTQLAPKRLARTEKVQRENASPAGLSAPEQRILSTVSMLVARGLPLNRDSVARWIGIHPNGSRYNTSLASLRAQGCMNGFQIHIGDENGAPFDPPYPAGPDGVLQALKEESQRRIFREILQADKHLSREELAERLGIHPNGSRYNTTLAWLRDMGVIPERGSIYPTEGVYR